MTTEIPPQPSLFTPELVQRLQRALLAEGDETLIIVATSDRITR